MLLYIIVGVNQLSCEPETLKINKLLYISWCCLQVIWGKQPANNTLVSLCLSQLSLFQIVFLRLFEYVEVVKILTYIVGSRGASQLGGYLLGTPPGYKANKL